MKKFFAFFSLASLASGFNTLYKYITVQNALFDYNYNSSVIGNFVTSSSISISYVSIFFLSLFFSLSVFLLYLKCFNFNYKNILYFDLLIIISLLLLFLNTFLSLIILLLGFLLIIFFIRKSCNIKLVITLFVFIYISLYFVSC
ncbi:MAG: hypothetical protein IKF82_03730 [Bacilli bacterium]|nr:hypothetical protein [Bacilli bacterium]